MGIVDLVKVDVGLVDELPQLGHLADLLEGKDFIFLVAVDGQTSRVVSSVFETGEAFGALSDTLMPPDGSEDSPLIRVSRINLRSFSTK